MVIEENKEIEDILITNLDFLLTLSIFKGIIEKDISNIDLEKFTKVFNSFFFESGEYGYEDAGKIGIITAQEYTKEQVEKYIGAIQNSVNVADDSIEIKEISEAPYMLSLELSREVGTSSSDLRKGDINFGILKGNEVVGYVNGRFWDLGLAIDGLYIIEKYRKKGFGLELLENMMKKSVEKGFNRLDLSNASWSGQHALLRLAKKYEKEGEGVQFESGDEDLKNYAVLELNNKGQKNSYFKNRKNVNDNFIDFF